MKQILFDVDGVFLSEERCFDVSALTVYEMLYSDQFLNLQSTIDLTHLSENDIRKIRKDVFLDDKILNQLKSLGLNSNWDMLFIVISTHLIDLLKKANTSKFDLSNQNFSIETLKGWSKELSNYNIELETPLEFLSQATSGKENIYSDLIEFAKSQLNIEDASIFELKSRFWDIAQELYQEWYLGFELYEEVEKKLAKTDFKKGYIKEEVVLADITKVNELLTDLKNNGFQIGIATGRPRTETLVPFETIGWLTQFDEYHIGTASEVLNAETTYPEHKPLGKPNPFSYLIAHGGNSDENYLTYINNQEEAFKDKEIYIVGDSLADLLSAKKTGATFIGTLTGLKGQAARAELEENDADYIVDNVLDIRNILIK
ncbi:HAD family hydrolase [Mammaliicoccus lentus]|uniref:HAD family hydrolase n=1 Tax=Mammaliicoccus lentus TaxID=42858 RepID=UPI0007D96166|nr:HAD hydrolase-like protein [Mammaliicoccus lentus]MBF0793606.1 HAD family hydrolase [Mammaliicoccus lentus]MBW0770266.1 HAD hydrolase-like protein [Mammaliicoccus lentus]OAO32429.1 HAD family hydrolase [Mammaliicoccus lentus]TFV18098.1 HAD family hydrolase [Mammaliicoccus lentus]WGZ44025.1 HAD hydrolase-like protein [Mammaliicoccus lentus]